MPEVPPTVTVCRRLRRVLALPLYAIALLLSFASDLPAKIAGDDVEPMG